MDPILADYARLLRPSVLKQLTPDVVALLNELPAFDRQNKAALGRLLGVIAVRGAVPPQARLDRPPQPRP